MTRKKQPPEVSIVRSSAAEYLTFVAATGSQQQAVEMRYEDENIWLSQKMMATLYDVTVPAISQHLKRIFTDRELIEEAVVKQYLTTAADGKTYNVKHYNDVRRRSGVTMRILDASILATPGRWPESVARKDGPNSSPSFATGAPTRLAAPVARPGVTGAPWANVGCPGYFTRPRNVSAAPFVAVSVTPPAGSRDAAHQGPEVR